MNPIVSDVDRLCVQKAIERKKTDTEMQLNRASETLEMQKNKFDELCNLIGELKERNNTLSLENTELRNRIHRSERHQEKKKEEGEEGNQK